jgi:hypothetical protein
MNSKPVVELTGNDGNALSIVASCRRAARKAGWKDDKWEKVQKEMLGGDYDNVLQTAMKYFEVE